MVHLRGWYLGFALLLTAAALLVLWLLRVVVLALFAGMLLGVFLHRVARRLRRAVPLPQTVAVLAVLLVLTVVLVSSGSLFAATAAWQFEALARTIPESLAQLRVFVDDYPALQRQWREAADFGTSLQGQRYLVTGLRGAVSTTTSVVGTIFVAVAFAIYAAFEPGLYARGVCRLFPVTVRPRIRLLLQRSSQVLWWWLLGRVAAMIIIGGLTTLVLMLLGVPLAVSLGLLAGVFSFVPYVGPILAGIPGILVGLTQGVGMALAVFGVYVGVQIIEGNLLTPLIERRTVHLPPALAIGAQLVAGVLAGPLGLMLASPLTAVAMVAVQTLYVEGLLGDTEGQPLGGGEAA